MNKKKILNFIEELKTMADNLDEGETAAATPYAVTTYNPLNEIHNYKSFALPEQNISVQIDLLEKTMNVPKTVIGLFDSVKTFTGLKPALIYTPNMKSSCFGEGFSLNIIEKLENIEKTTQGVTYC